MAVAVQDTFQVLEGVGCESKMVWDRRIEGLPGRVLMLTGPSGVGKSTLGEYAHETDPVHLAIMSWTDRPARQDDKPWEIESVSPEQIDHWRQGEKDAWMATAHGHRYVTLKKDFLGALCAGGVHIANVVPLVPYELPVQFIESGKVIPYYIVAPPERELRRRFAERGDADKAKIENRIRDCAEWNDWVESQQRIDFRLIDGRLPKPEMIRFFANDLERLSF